MIVDPQQTPTSDLYRLMIRSVVPRPIAWVSTVSSQGSVNLAPFSFFNAVSADPPTLCFAPGRHRDGTKKDTLRNVEETHEFVVNIVNETLADAMNVTATEYPYGVNEFEEARLESAPSERVAPPRVAGSPVSFECQLRDVIYLGRGGGGSALVIGEAVLIHISDAVLVDGKVDPGRLEAVGRMGAMDYTTTRDRFTLIRRLSP
jgi:flavin reductase (DIM6/NTAB) family NADH-FMN oxidoreductase RutF